MEYRHRVAEQRVCAGVARIGSCAHYDFEIRESLAQFGDNSPGRVDFAEADSVNPDAFLFWVVASEPAEPVGYAILRLRKKLGDLGEAIETVWGVGYRLGLAGS